MRVALVVRSDGFAGVERHIATLARGLADHSHEVTVIGGDQAAMRNAIDRAVVRQLPATTVPAVVRRLLQVRTVEIIHAHMTAAELAVAVGRPALSGPLVTTRHFAGSRGSTTISRALGHCVEHTVSRQIAISRYVAQAVEGSSVVVHPGTADRPAGPRAVARDTVVLVAQRLELEKRTDLALRVWAESGLAARGWQLQIAGTGSQLATLRSLAVDLGIGDSVQFLGQRGDVTELMARSAALLAPCPVEGFGLSVVEAMASATPVIAAAAGGHLETVGAAPNPVLFDPTDPEDGARKLAASLADPERRERYGAELQALARAEFSERRMVERTIAVYRSVMA